MIGGSLKTIYIIGSGFSVGVGGPNTYLRAATMAALRGEPVLLPHRLA